MSNSGGAISSQDSKANSLWRRSFIRVGHGGAAGRVPANTLESLGAALDIGVDMVEFDVRPCLGGLVLLHDDKVVDKSGNIRLASQSTFEDLRKSDLAGGLAIASLEEALDLLKGRALINVDLKTNGIEADVVKSIARAKVSSDVLISSLDANSLRRVREIKPTLKTAISYPRDRGNVSTRPTLRPAIAAALKLLRFLLQFQIISKMQAARADAAMLHFDVISVETVRKVHESNGLIFAWTVDDLSTMRRVQSMGVDGIASNFPELFNETDYGSPIAQVRK